MGHTQLFLASQTLNPASAGSVGRGSKSDHSARRGCRRSVVEREHIDRRGGRTRRSGRTASIWGYRGGPRRASRPPVVATGGTLWPPRAGSGAESRGGGRAGPTVTGGGTTRVRPRREGRGVRRAERERGAPAGGDRTRPTAARATAGRVTGKRATAGRDPSETVREVAGRRRAVARRERRRSARRGRAGQERVVAGGPAARALARKTAHARARGGDSVAPADGACGQQASGGTIERSVRERGQAWRSTNSASGGGRGAR